MNKSKSVEALRVIGKNLSDVIEDEELRSALFISAAALRKQIPQRPDIVPRGRGVTRACPTCKSDMLSGLYCSCCGQALDWGLSK